MTRAEKVARAQALRADGLLLREIAARMGVAITTVHAWLADPDRSLEIARKLSYGGECDTCGGPTDGSNGAAKAPTRCRDCRTWTPDAIIAALQGWGDDHGGIPPRAVDTHLGQAGHGRLPWDDIVKRYFGSWNAGLLAAGYEGLHQDKRPETTQGMADAIRAGLRTEEVGEMFGVSAAAVHVRLRYHGMKVSELRRAA